MKTPTRAAANETSPLLPKLHPSSSASRNYTAPDARLEAAKAKDLRRRRKYKQAAPAEDDSFDDDDDNNNDEDGYRATDSDYGESDVLVHRRPADRRTNRERPLSYSSDSSMHFQGLGNLKRKPRWSGFREKIAQISGANAKPFTTADVKPRAVSRRGRFRSSDYEDGVGMTRQMRQRSSSIPMARIAAYCTCEQIGLIKLLKWLESSSKEQPSSPGTAKFHLLGWKSKMYMGVVHAYFDPNEQPNAKSMPPQQAKHAFYFATGCCVFWGLTREEESRHILLLETFSSGPVARIEAEDMEFGYGDKSYIANDAIYLSSTEVAEKLAVSFALAQSAKLDIFEERVDDRIRNTKHIPFNLSTTGSIQYSQKDISKLIGMLFMELADVNLHSDILDEPEFFWEDDKYEPLYKRMLKYLDVANRVKILNKRLDILRELVDVLNQELTRKHGTKLEWIIIWLLVAEIFIAVVWNMLIKDILGFFHHGR
ncbi:TPA: hypothetical protein N0F65_009598 [Lagenidium giganteum]|uniref:DUF155 domain-containing protein n=1 Tax=Lagenidium giganteum TaxID=4803 RepID=A0AAV2YWR1_9STRA|nr:TPA: hypothetical protein N0F65_009598 [Lagenidium giganteum]